MNGHDMQEAEDILDVDIKNAAIRLMIIEGVLKLLDDLSRTTKTKGCPLRRDEVLLIKKLGYEGWKQLKDTGRRCIAEIVFSSMKRVLGVPRSSKHRKGKLD